MKYYNEKIQNFYLWCEGNEILLPDTTWFDVYRLDEKTIEPLTDEERSYVMLRQRAQLKEYGYRGIAKGDVTKFVLTNEHGWSEKSKIDEKIDLIKWDETDLGDK